MGWKEQTGWHGSIGDYSGPSLPTANCTACKYYINEAGKIIGKDIHHCKSGTTGCEAGRMASTGTLNPPRGTCERFEKVSSGEKASAGSSGGGRGGKGVISGVGQALDGVVSGNAGDLVGGAGKVALGVGGLAMKGIGALGKAAVNTTKEAVQLEMARMAEEKVQDTNNLKTIRELTFGEDSLSICTALETLYSMKPGGVPKGLDGVAGASLVMGKSTKDQLFDAIIGKMELGVRTLRGIGDNTSADIYEKKLKKVQNKRLLKKLFPLIMFGVLLLVVGGLFLAVWLSGALEIPPSP